VSIEAGSAFVDGAPETIGSLGGGSGALAGGASASTRAWAGIGALSSTLAFAAACELARAATGTSEAGSTVCPGETIGARATGTGVPSAEAMASEWVSGVVAIGTSSRSGSVAASEAAVAIGGLELFATVF
jgi:hypothetical protein